METTAIDPDDLDYLAVESEDSAIYFRTDIVKCDYDSHIKVELTLRQVYYICRDSCRNHRGELICRDDVNKNKGIKVSLESKLVKSQIPYWNSVKDKIAKSLKKERLGWNLSDHNSNIKRLIWAAAWSYFDEY